MTRFRIIIFIFMLLPVGLAQAVIVNNLNTADVPVANQSKAALAKALPQALSEVLVKISGNPGVMTLPSIQNALPNINQYVQSFSYQEKTEINNNKQWYAHIIFDRKGLRKILQKASQPIWGANRPLILVWLTIDDQQGERVLSSGTKNELSQALQKIAAARGLPILLPAMDLQDQSYINSNTSFIFDQQKLAQAAQRYGVKMVLAGKLTPNATGGLQSQWLLFQSDQQPFQWRSPAQNEIAAVSKAVNDAANTLANQFAMVAGGSLQSTVLLEVMGVNDIDGYAKVVSYLRHLTPVTQVSISAMDHYGLLLEVKTVGGAQELIHAISQGQQMQEIPTPLSQGADRADLYYRFVSLQARKNVNAKATST